MEYSTKEVSEILKIQKHTLLYHIRKKECVKVLFKQSSKDKSYSIDSNNIQALAELLYNDNIITKDALKDINTSVKTDFKTSLEDSETVNPDNADIIKILNERIEGLKKELEEKNRQINKLLELNRNSQILLLENKSENQEEEKKSLFKKIKDFLKFK